ncbi:hypothetical protein BSR28_02140 [Boudabousia liubingyangii]|uniref:ABC transporter ATP-binding protein n=1 Tax=Boudabousia liubingyangii TaxID=1921764 RepID=UPI00093E79FD|nr:ABC transporter ATP-binding protein [Boudabousia liubingyangii]OKL48511.1 hypothetical protein BSR28_02140 [Boudabousia liubingyangii]
MTSKLTLSEVSFAYGRNQPALKSISFKSDQEFIGILGPNGSGKTTLLRLLAGITQPTSGEIRYLDKPLKTRQDRSDYQQHVGYLPQNPYWPGETTVKTFLTYFAALRDVPKTSQTERVTQVLSQTNCLNLITRPLKSLSGGEQKRIFLAQSLLTNPEILILDEPTVALDPQQRIAFRDLIKTHANGKTIFWSTHIVEDLRYLADRILIIQNGQIIWHNTTQELINLGQKAENLNPDASDLERGFLHVIESNHPHAPQR